MSSGAGENGGGGNHIGTVQAQNVVLSPVAPVHQTVVLQGAPPAPSGKSVFVLHDAGDHAEAEALAASLRQQGHAVPELRREEGWSARDDAELRGASFVVVAWSVHARRSARVAAGLDAAYGLGRGRGFVGGERLDGADLPLDVDGRPRLAVGRTLSWLLVAAGWAALARVGPWGPPTTALAAATLLPGALLVLVGWTGLPRRVGLSSALHEAADGVARADVPEMLHAAERILALVFGAKTWSLRAVVAGAMPTGIVVAFTVAASGTYFERRGATWTIGALESLERMWTVILGNVVLDVVALQATRSLLPWILRRPTRGRILAGLGLDAAVLVLCVLGAAASNVQGMSDLAYAGDGAWLGQVFTWLGLLLAGELSLAGLATVPYAAMIVGTGLAVLTGSFASLVHLGLLGLAGLNRLGGGLPGVLVSAATRRWADAGPGPAFVAWAGVSALALGVAVELGPAESTPCADGEACWPAFLDVPLDTYCPASLSCGIGSPASEAERRANEGRVYVTFSKPVAVMDREASQGWWATKLGEARTRHEPDIAALVARLEEVAPVHVGDPALPMEGVAWCDAARFANLLSLLEEQAPAHVQGGDPALPGCEDGTGGPIHLAVHGGGYRLPTEAEWEVLARAGSTDPWPVPQGQLPRFAWFLDNAGWRTRPVAGLEPNAWGLHDTHGNVWEWTADAWSSERAGGRDPLFGADDPGAWRVFRGGSFVNPARVLRSACRFGGAPQVRVHGLGFRLVRPPRPPRP